MAHRPQVPARGGVSPVCRMMAAPFVVNTQEQSIAMLSPISIRLVFISSYQSSERLVFREIEVSLATPIGTLFHLGCVPR